MWIQFGVLLQYWLKWTWKYIIHPIVNDDINDRCSLLSIFHINKKMMYLHIIYSQVWEIEEIVAQSQPSDHPSRHIAFVARTWGNQLFGVYSSTRRDTCVFVHDACQWWCYTYLLPYILWISVWHCKNILLVDDVKIHFEFVNAILMPLTPFQSLDINQALSATPLELQFEYNQFQILCIFLSLYRCKYQIKTYAKTFFF